MDITPLIAADRQVIQSYSEDGFRISGRRYNEPVFVFPDRIVPWSGDLEDVNSLAPLWEASPVPEVVLLGTGNAGKWPSKDLRALLKDKGITVEPMGTGAACRTFNVLLTEERLMAAALLPLESEK